MPGHRDDDRSGRDTRPKKVETKPKLHISGDIDKMQVTVLLPGNPERGDDVTFAAGPEDNPLRRIVMIDKKAVVIKVGVDGVARGVLNLAGAAADVTHLAAGFKGRYSDPVVLPPHDSAAATTSKNKRLKVGSDGDVIVSRIPTFTILIQTFDPTGKKLEAADVVIRTSKAVTIKNADSNRKICDHKHHCRTTIKDGMLFVNLEFGDGMECTLLVTHPDSGESITKTLRLE